jgi:hypothetical protein
MKVALIMATVICITNGKAENKFRSIWSTDMVKTITGEVIKRYFANCVYFLHSSYDQGENLAVDFTCSDQSTVRHSLCRQPYKREVLYRHTIIVFLRGQSSWLQIKIPG